MNSVLKPKNNVMLLAFFGAKDNFLCLVCSIRTQFALAGKPDHSAGFFRTEVVSQQDTCTRGNQKAKAVVTRELCRP